MSTPKGLGALPSRNADDAPSFRSDEPEELDDYLAEIEALASTYTVPDAHKVHAAIRYADASAKRLWKSSDGYNEVADKCDWAIFKKDLTDSFYQSSKKSKYSMRDLEDLVHKWKKRSMDSERRLEEYHRAFTPVAKALEKCSVISEKEMQCWFWKGIHRSARKEIES